MSAPVVIPTDHDTMIHDAQFDYYGRRLAVSSSDGTVTVYDVNADSTLTKSGVLRAHSGPVWSVAFAHPRFGPLLATASYDRRVLVWRETRPGVWDVIYECRAHTASVNSVAFAPAEHGLLLASASSDGSIAVHAPASASPAPGSPWSTTRLDLSAGGLNALSWMPAAASLAATAASRENPAPPARRVVAVAACDGTVRLVALDSATGALRPGAVLEGGHTDWVRDVAFAPCAYGSGAVLASCGQDATVAIWEEGAGDQWTRVALPKFGEAAWRVSWSVGGQTLAVACGDDSVTLWRASADRSKWELVQTVEGGEEQEAGQQTQQTQQ